MNIWENDMLCVRELGMRITNTKERLILAAIELFSTKGYEGTSVEEIAKAVGIKAPSIYDHFKGKEALLYAVRDYADIAYDKGMQFSRAQSEIYRKAASIRRKNSEMFIWKSFMEKSRLKMQYLHTITIR